MKREIPEKTNRISTQASEMLERGIFPKDQGKTAKNSLQSRKALKIHG